MDNEIINKYNINTGNILEKDAVIGGKYIVEAVLGRGSGSIVYLVFHKELELYRAAKASFYSTEIDVLKKLKHPLVPDLYDCFCENGIYYFIEEFVEGETLEKKLREGGSFSLEEVLNVGINLCNVLGYLHTRKPYPVIYRDIKPSNIIQLKNRTIKLIDFSAAREFKPDVTDDTVYLGTKGYAAPEQYGTGQSGTATDFYNLGITLYRLFTGEFPRNDNDKAHFDSKTALNSVFCSKAALNSDDMGYCFKEAVQVLIFVIGKCIELNPHDRYKSASEIKRELIRAQNMLTTNKEARVKKAERIGHLTGNEKIIYTGRPMGIEEPVTTVKPEIPEKLELYEEQVRAEKPATTEKPADMEKPATTEKPVKVSSKISTIFWNVLDVIKLVSGAVIKPAILGAGILLIYVIARRQTGFSTFPFFDSRVDILSSHIELIIERTGIVKALITIFINRKDGIV